MIIEKINKKLKEKETALKIVIERKKTIKQKKIKERKNKELLEKAKIYVINIGKNTQRGIKKYIEDTVTFALQSVFGNDYKAVIVIDVERKQQNVSFFVEDKEILLEPKEDTVGGGIIDVYSFALRLVVHSLEKPKSAPIIIIDEPFKNVSEGYQELVASMVKDLSKTLRLQIIMPTHMGIFINDTENNIINISP